MCTVSNKEMIKLLRVKLLRVKLLRVKLLKVKLLMVINKLYNVLMKLVSKRLNIFNIAHLQFHIVIVLNISSRM